jgi:hypothetical protein
MIDLYEFLIFFLAITIHEITHWLLFRLKDKRTTIKLTWFGMVTVTKAQLSVSAYVSNLLSAIFIGYGIMLMLSTSKVYIMAYLLCCSLDFASIIKYIDLINKKYLSWKDSTSVIKSYIKGKRYKGI